MVSKTQQKKKSRIKKQKDHKTLLLNEVLGWIVSNDFSNTEECGLCGSHDYCRECNNPDYSGHLPNCSTANMIIKFKEYCLKEGVELDKIYDNYPKFEEKK